MTCALRVRGVPRPRRSMRASVPEIRALRRSAASRLLFRHPRLGRLLGLVDVAVLLPAAELQRHRLLRTSAPRAAQHMVAAPFDAVARRAEPRELCPRLGLGLLAAIGCWLLRCWLLRARHAARVTVLGVVGSVRALIIALVALASRRAFPNLRLLVFGLQSGF